ncbi:type II methionyl aminopeptidase [Candidatus Woesearchaeota archaeon CG_4_10_14_0_8_um_filter_47_5]|nr:MAG: type II methionyl aminopeptidase [Candidatus Woesearchaeota archaeon CG_4_10_14_0_8_um_filter_47_5]
MTDQDELEQWKQAGKLAARALEHGASLITKGASLLEVTDKTEAFILQHGGKPAFPVQISMNAIAAHYCPEDDDILVFDDQVVKIDVGVSLNGYIGDNACTIDLSGRHQGLVDASREALDNAIHLLRPGTTLGEVGKIIQDTISRKGFAPIRNLSGHGVGVYEFHTAPTIPNIDTHDPTPLTTGQVIAIEPFATTGHGTIVETTNASVFSVVLKKPVRNRITRKVLKHIEDTYQALPFTTRWLLTRFNKLEVTLALRELLLTGVIRGYPPLVERDKGMVSQAEHTVYIGEEPIVLTRP